ncbi:hypothetical protein MTO96_002323 [Rhipicephalus appendiculatus]
MTGMHPPGRTTQSRRKWRLLTQITFLASLASCMLASGVGGSHGRRHRSGRRFRERHEGRYCFLHSPPGRRASNHFLCCSVTDRDVVQASSEFKRRTRRERAR